MTDHPLTDEKILSIADEAYHLPGYQDDMRAAADWQVEQVIEWLRSMHRREYVLYTDDDTELNEDELIADLKRAMRPQEES